MRYGFISKDGKEYNCDDCELRRFKFWWSLCGRREMKAGYVELDNGEKWIWYNGRYSRRWEKI